MSNFEHNFQHICNSSLGISYIHTYALLIFSPSSLNASQTPPVFFFSHGDYSFQFALLCRATSPHLRWNPLLFPSESQVCITLTLMGEHNHCGVFGRPGAITLKNLIILPLEDKHSWEFMSAAILSWQEYSMYFRFSSCLPYSTSLAVNAYNIKIQKYCIA